MESSRKRFKSDISNSYVQEMFSKKKAKQIGGVKKRRHDSGPTINTVTHIPSEMLAKAKLPVAQLEKEYAKPDHWTRPEQVAKKLSREEVFEVERLNIKKTLVHQQAWSRAARTVTTAIKPKQAPSHPIIPDTEEDDPLNQPAGLSKDSDQVVRKNHSREFLQSFFKMASSIAESDMERKRKEIPQAVKNAPRPKLKLIVEP